MTTLRGSHRDPQQFDLYDAEDKLRGHRHVIFYRDASDAKQFLQHVVRSSLWRQMGGPEKIAVKVTRHDSGVATCYSGKGLICLPGWALNTRTILHEMAHLVSDDGHGKQFAAAALKLYRAFISSEFADQMSVLYRVHGVQVQQEEVVR